MNGAVLRVLAMLVALALPGAVSAQAGRTAKRVPLRRAAAVWMQARDGGWTSRADDRDSDGDSDRDRDSDSDSDSDGRRGGIFGRDSRGDRRRSDVECRDVERDLERAHDSWHRQNDRYRRDRRYDAEHERMHDRVNAARRRAGCDRGLGSTLEDIIFGGGDRNRRDRGDRRGRTRDGGVLDRLPLPGGGRDAPRTGGTARLESLGDILGALFGGG